MTEIEQIKEYKNINFWDYPYLNDSLFEYVNAVANHFWWEADVYSDNESGEPNADKSPSHVPSKFARRYLNGEIGSIRHFE